MAKYFKIVVKFSDRLASFLIKDLDRIVKNLPISLWGEIGHVGDNALAVILLTLLYNRVNFNHVVGLLPMQVNFGGIFYGNYDTHAQGIFFAVFELWHREWSHFVFFENFPCFRTQLPAVDQLLL